MTNQILEKAYQAIEEYVEEFATDTKLDPLADLKMQQAMKSSLTHKWLGRKHRQRVEVEKIKYNMSVYLDTKAEKLFKDKMKNGHPTLSKPACINIIKSSPEYKKFELKHIYEKLISEYLDDTLKQWEAHRFEVSNLTNIVKIEESF